MAYEMRELSGSLFVNDKKSGDTHPGWKGSALVGGTEFWVSAWVKPTKDGGKWISLSFTAKDQAPKHDRQSTSAEDRARNAASIKMQAPSGLEFNDDIPFAPAYRRMEYLV
jgi:hypothetical protein